MYALVRADLGMLPGKLAAQAGHAFTEALYEALDARPDEAARYRRERGSKVVLVVPDLDELERRHVLALRAGLPCALFTDSGHVHPPHFDGSPVVTALGVGPCTRHEARAVRRKLGMA